MTLPGQLSGIALECPEPMALAQFYSNLTGWPIVYSDADWCSIGESEDAAFHLSFQRSAAYRAPVWPDPASSMQFHLHVRVADLDAGEAAAITALAKNRLATAARARAPIRAASAFKDWIPNSNSPPDARRN